MLSFELLLFGVIGLNREIETEMSEELLMKKIPGDIFNILRQNGSKMRINVEQDCLEMFQIILNSLLLEVERSVRRKHNGSLQDALAEGSGDFNHEDIDNACLADFEVIETAKVFTKPIGIVRRKGSASANKALPFRQLVASKLECLACRYEVIFSVNTNVDHLVLACLDE